LNIDVFEEAMPKEDSTPLLGPEGQGPLDLYSSADRTNIDATTPSYQTITRSNNDSNSNSINEDDEDNSTTNNSNSNNNNTPSSTFEDDIAALASESNVTITKSPKKRKSMTWSRNQQDPPGTSIEVTTDSMRSWINFDDIRITAKQKLKEHKSLVSRIRYYVPILSWLPKYKSENFASDLVAGITLGIFIAPQALAYANLVGVPPIYGLQSAFYPIIIYFCLGNSRQLSVGPEAIVSILVSGALDNILDTDASPEERAGVACVITLLVGLFTLVLGVFRFGYLAYIFSRPLLCGFINAVGIEIILEQVDKFFGMSLHSHTFYKIPEIYDKLDEAKWLAMILGLICVAIMVAFRVIKHKRPQYRFLLYIPDTLVIVVCTITFSYTAGLNDKYDLPILGKVEPGFLSPQMPDLDFDQIQRLASVALVIAMIGIVESILGANVYATKHNYMLSSNRELVALGLANTLGSMFRMFPAFGSLPRTAMNDGAGAKTLLSTLFTAIILLLVITLLLPLFNHLPIVVMGAIIVNAALGLFEIHDVIFLYKIRAYKDLALLSVTFLTTLIFGVTMGIGLSIMISLFMVVRQTSAPHVAIMKQSTDTKKFEDVAVIRDINLFHERHYWFTLSQFSSDKGVLMVRIEESLYFANIGQLKELFQKIELRGNSPLHAIILDASNIPEIDASATQILYEMVLEWEKRNIMVCFVKVRAPTKHLFIQSGLVDAIGSERFFYKRMDAVNYALGRKVDYSSYQSPQTIPI